MRPCEMSEIAISFSREFVVIVVVLFISSPCCSRWFGISIKVLVGWVESLASSNEKKAEIVHGFIISIEGSWY